jgi:hypothetical protein
MSGRSRVLQVGEGYYDTDIPETETDLSISELHHVLVFTGEYMEPVKNAESTSVSIYRCVLKRIMS